jgi:outer membrane protein TolC
MKRSEQSCLSVLVCFALVSGCAVGPNYKQPQISIAASFANSPTNIVTGDEAMLATWWKGFEDPKLNALIEQAIAHNHDLRIATANLKEARALRRLTTFDLVPTVQANAFYDNRLLSKAAAFPGTPRDKRELEFFDASFDATWELDLFGRVRRSVEAANAQVAATEADRLDVLVSVTAEVARNYLELRGQQISSPWRTRMPRCRKKPSKSPMTACAADAELILMFHEVVRCLI